MNWESWRSVRNWPTLLDWLATAANTWRQDKGWQEMKLGKISTSWFPHVSTKGPMSTRVGNIKRLCRCVFLFVPLRVQIYLGPVVGQPREESNFFVIRCFQGHVYIYVCILYAYVFSYVEKLIFIYIYICIFYIFMFLHVFV